MTGLQMRRMLRNLHWYFTTDQRLTTGECSLQFEHRSELEECRPTMAGEEATLLVETDQAIARRMPEIRVVLPNLPDRYMVRWHGESHWWWTGEVPAGITD